jgi:lipoprotein-releasing system permease protein
VEFSIGWRYVRAGRRTQRGNRFISFISWLSALGIALGVAALIVVLSVMNGFQKEVRDRMLSVLAHIEVFENTTGAVGLDQWSQLANQLRSYPQVLGVAPFVSGQAMMTRGEIVRGVLVRGIDPRAEGAVSQIAAQVREGSLAGLHPGEYGIALGRELARAMGVDLDDRVTLIAPQGTMTPVGMMPRLKPFRVVAIFDSGHYEYDSTLALTAMDDAAKLFRAEGPMGLRLRVDDMQAAPRIARELAAQLPSTLAVRDWSSENRSWFAAVQVEKRMMFIILALIIAVAAFNLVSMLVMTVTDKQADIAILRTLGASPGAIQRIFILQGTVIGLLGTALGVALGVALAWSVGDLVAGIERLLGVEFLPPGIYFITRLPSDLRWDDVVRIGGVAVLLSVVATIYPSYRAARTRPVEALRHE